MSTRRSIGACVAIVLSVVALSQSPASAASKAATHVSATFSAPTIIAGTATKLTGAVSPKRPGELLYLQEYYSEAWHKVATKKLSSKSRYSFTIEQPAAGQYYYRVSYKGDKRSKASNSAYHLLTVQPMPYQPKIGDQSVLHDQPYADLVYRFDGYGWAYQTYLHPGACTGAESSQRDAYGIAFDCVYQAGPSNLPPVFLWTKTQSNHNSGSSTPTQGQPPAEYATSNMSLYVCPSTGCA